MGLKFICGLVLLFYIGCSRESDGKPLYGFSSRFSSIFDQLAKHLESRLRSGTCEACKLVSDLIQVMFATNTSEDEIVHLAVEFCSKFKVEDQRVCSSIVKLFRPEVLTVFDRVFLSSDEICGELIGPTCGHVKKDVFWNVSLPNTPKPPVQPIKPPKVR